MSLTVQFYTMLSMIGMGAWTGAALDTYQRFLQRSKRKRWFVFINDVLFWTVQALLVFYVLLLSNEAELRIYVFVALLCGFAAYQSMLKRIYTSLLEMMIRFVIRTYHFLATVVKVVIIRPLLTLVQLLLTISIFVLKLLQKIAQLLYKFTIKILLVAWKIISIPIAFILRLLWKVLPNRVKIFIRHYAGFLRKVEKMKVKILGWWEYIKNRLGGPRK
ncbi:spore cortex biosynthesis protein YabQ [Ectobacillus antri]|jgi:spore cortex biosynthesis protein YabQ|uniref:Spore cortex biosynthesis protein YabQ n=1 Tax=Ectobacillus antri TaxID=2486280 RepID=A0ABT6H8C8_9BACI|nr:spore cortex biosynthesis protein YabQ [Ectobacillus antri]MDG4657971.1 spore cortex biosynthesis protein YabQ [Ectobacillus antri]MDG5755043.1 spore cortex biosynthesis protein YabQ [Ectobacillus antri]